MGPCTGWPFRSLQIYAYLVHGVQDGQAELNPDAQSIWESPNSAVERQDAAGLWSQWRQHFFWWVDMGPALVLKVAASEDCGWVPHVAVSCCDSNNSQTRFLLGRLA